MNIKSISKIGNIFKRRVAVVKNYRNNPGDFDAAAHAAFHYAKKNNEDMVVVPGNSYMSKVFHIARKSDDISKFFGMKAKTVGAVVTLAGEVFKAELS